MARAAETQKYFRMMALLLQLQRGEVLTKEELAKSFGVNERSIQRDIEDLRTFLSEQHDSHEVIYDYKRRGYRLIDPHERKFSDGEALAVCKILLESRSLRRDEMFPILEKLVHGCVPADSQKQAEQLIANEKYLYVEPHHGQLLTEKLWEIGQAVREQRLMMVKYERINGPTVERILKPVGIMFSEFYFYLTAFIVRDEDDEISETLFPTIYRIDRIKSFEIFDEHFQVLYKDRFQEGEFRKRIQFMYGGELRRIKFSFIGPSIEAVLDKLPTATATKETDGSYTVTAEVFGDGVDMWLRSQGDWVCNLA